MSASSEYWLDRTRTALENFDESLLRQIGQRLLKPRTPIPADELVDRIVGTLANPPVIDRRIRELPPTCQQLLAILDRSRRPQWKVGHLLTTLATVGSSEGLTPITTLFQSGFLYPVRNGISEPLAAFEPWLHSANVLNAEVFALPEVAARARDHYFPFEEFIANCKEEGLATGPVRIADGLEWPLRFAVVEQLLSEGTMRTTQANALFKRDLQRLQTHDILGSAPADHVTQPPDYGALALFWCLASGRLATDEGVLSTSKRARTNVGLTDLLLDMSSGLYGVEGWDPLIGYQILEQGLPAFPSATMVCFLLMSSMPKGRWIRPTTIAAYLWAHHPSWQGNLPKESHKNHGTDWVENLLIGVAYSLRMVEVQQSGEEWLVRLSDMGRHLFNAEAKPADVMTPPQTLLVQPNAEIIAYRQGLTPAIIDKLSHIAQWKSLGSVCMLELTPEQTYRGLESGLNLAGIVQTLNQHGTRPVPPAVNDLLQRWANKRDRISVFANVTLVEFASPTDLDSAMSRGIVAIRVTDRIGLCSDGSDPDFKHLRLTGNRDYESRPSQCLTLAEDGITLSVDPAQSDLLLEAEIGRLAEMIPGEPSGVRRFKLTPAVLRKAFQQGWSLDDLEAWFVARTGQSLPATARLFAIGPDLSTSRTATRTVVYFPDAATAEGVIRWPATRALVFERLGPSVISVEAENLPRLREALAEVGVTIEDEVAR